MGRCFTEIKPAQCFRSLAFNLMSTWPAKIDVQPLL
ncbi:Uncharacterised protein [Vibrio cholerae]|nr:Uncharacterised protein [Vibrio cholerae]